MDLIFPHHEAEIAQMESVSGRGPLARYWLHTGFLNIDRAKMSKSLGNAFAIRAMLERVDARQLRFLLLSHHYRSPIEYADDLLAQARGALRRIDRFYERLEPSAGSSSEADETRRKLVEALDDDFDTPAAFAVLFDFIRTRHRSGRQAAGSRALLADFFALTGIAPPPSASPDTELSDMVQRAIAERERLRREGRYSDADAIRASLRRRGVELEDTPDGVRWHRARERG